MSGNLAIAEQRLRRDGWCLLEEALPVDHIGALMAALSPVFEQTLFCRGGFYGERTKRFGRLLARSTLSHALVEHKQVLALAERILRPWCDTIQLNLTQGVEIHPGALAQLPHRDQDMWQGVKGEVEYLVNVIWPLTPFTLDNGATRIFPNSHGPNAMADTNAIAPVTVETGPGSAILFLGSTLHGAGANESLMPRQAIIVSYCLGWLKPYENQWLAYPPDVARHFPATLAGLVGYRQHRPNLGNIEGLCPSLLLGSGLPDRTGAQDALRPDQAEQVRAYVAQQRAVAVPARP